MSPSTETMGVDIGEAPILDLEGRAIPLSSLWRDRTVVLSFVRHFG